MEPQDARSAFTRSRVFRGPHDENPYIPIRGWNHPFLDSMQFPRGHVRPPVFRGFLSSAVYRRRAEGPDEKAWARIRAMQCVLGRGVCFCRPSSRRTARFLQQISSYKRPIPPMKTRVPKSYREMPGQRIGADLHAFSSESFAPPGRLQLAICCNFRAARRPKADDHLQVMLRHPSRTRPHEAPSCLTHLSRPHGLRT